ncbi:MAG TPA: sterol desaturase family protein [Candidatus Sulfotelmatobacter sp.]|nr:sterol desaturase family protein [Candidatus Sulfotelmatobacter sp.]
MGWTFLRHGSNTLLLALIAVVAIVLAIGVAPFHWLGAVIGALVFFGSEYTTHRFLLHAPPMKNPTVLKLQHRLHYDHHVAPTQLDLLFLPPWFVVPVTLLTAGIYAAITRDAGWTLSLLFGSLAGLFYYEWVHYVAHIPFQPVTGYGRWIKKYHLWHHYKNEHLWFGVTNPSTDVLGLTYRDVTEVDKSGTTRVLFPKE